MTFLPELKRLMDAATKGPFIVGRMEAPDGHAMAWHGNWYVDSEAPRIKGERYGDPEADAKLHKLFLDHAPALAELVEAADKIKRSKVSTFIYENGDVQTFPRLEKDFNEFVEALAKLNANDVNDGGKHEG